MKTSILLTIALSAMSLPAFGQEPHNPQFAVVGEPAFVAGPVGETSPPETASEPVPGPAGLQGPKGDRGETGEPGRPGRTTVRTRTRWAGLTEADARRIADQEIVNSHCASTGDLSVAKGQLRRDISTAAYTPPTPVAPMASGASSAPPAVAAAGETAPEEGENKMSITTAIALVAVVIVLGFVALACVGMFTGASTNTARMDRDAAVADANARRDTERLRLEAEERTRVAVETARETARQQAISANATAAISGAAGVVAGRRMTVNVSPQGLSMNVDDSAAARPAPTVVVVERRGGEKRRRKDGTVRVPCRVDEIVLVPAGSLAAERPA